MDAAVDALQQHDIDFIEQLRNGPDDLHAHVAHLRGELRDAVPAGRHVGSAGITGDDVDAGEIAVGLRIVEQFREGRHMRGVEAHDAGAEQLSAFPGRMRTTPERRR